VLQILVAQSCLSPLKKRCWPGSVLSLAKSCNLPFACVSNLSSAQANKSLLNHEYLTIPGADFLRESTCGALFSFS
jgi:hypothetical protein